MKIRRICISMSFFLLIASASGCDNRVDLPSRSECIVMISSNSASELSLVASDPDLLARKSRELDIALGGASFGGAGEIYLQFSDRCQERENSARNLMRAVLGGASDTVIYKSTGIVPSPNTIDVMGDAWKEERGTPFQK